MFPSYNVCSQIVQNSELIVKIQDPSSAIMSSASDSSSLVPPSIPPMPTLSTPGAPSATSDNSIWSLMVFDDDRASAIVSDSLVPAEYPVDGVLVPIVFEIPKRITTFPYFAADGSIQTCVPEHKEVVFDPPLGKALFAEWHGTWEMHIDDAAAKKTYRISLFQAVDTGAEISFQNPPGKGKRTKNKLTMGPRQGHWHIECDGSVIDGMFNFNFPENENFIGFRVFRNQPTKPYCYEGTDMMDRKVRLTIESRQMFCQSSPFWKTTNFI